MAESETIQEDITIATQNLDTDIVVVGEEDGDFGASSLTIPTILITASTYSVGKSTYSKNRYIVIPAQDPEATIVPDPVTLGIERCTLQPGLFDFHIKQGSIFNEQVSWLDSIGGAVDLTDFDSAYMEIRGNRSDVSPLITIKTSPGASDGTITLGGLNGTIDLEIAADLTAALSFDRGFYDLVMEVDGDEDNVILLEGNVFLHRSSLSG